MVNYKLDIANSRGKKPVMNDIKKIQAILNVIIYELNNNEAREQLRIVDNIIANIIIENK